jgi:hypothetical protein
LDGSLWIFCIAFYFYVGAYYSSRSRGVVNELYWSPCFSGMTNIRFRTFALYAYPEAFLYTGTFISLGKVLGPQWEHFYGVIKKYFIIAGIVIAVAIVLYLLYKSNVSAIGVILVVVMISLIQDFLANEFKQFDEVVGILVPLFFAPNWTPWIQWFASTCRTSSVHFSK